MAKSKAPAKHAVRKEAASKRNTAPKKKAAKKKAAPKKSAPRKWSRKVNETSDALDLEQGVFKGRDPKKIAQSLKRSATRSNRRKASPFQSAMSMLNFYINRGGKNLPASKKKVLEKSKSELRILFGKESK
ncbi:MAG TPA: DUF3175 domain-containing protein [Chitinophagaceae bacterium]|nr:DUF3175 domain-containing protein [Chitinophagaceae bacterium]